MAPTRILIAGIGNIFFGDDAFGCEVAAQLVDEHPGIVMMKTRVGGTRVVDMLSGEQLPRICWNVAHTPGNIKYPVTF
jgi:Ni,Fe-hydrogenase maturation factor